MPKGGRFGLVISVSVARSMYHQTLWKMTNMERTYDVSKYSPIDKANLYFEIALDSENEAEQVNYLIAALHQAQKGGLTPINFLIERMSNLPVNKFRDATENIKTRSLGHNRKCTGVCDNCNTEGFNPKISVSLGEVLAGYKNAIQSSD